MPIEKWSDQVSVVHLADDPQFTDDLEDRKSTRLNSSHLVISYAVFCLKKKKSRRPNEIRLLIFDLSLDPSHYFWTIARSASLFLWPAMVSPCQMSLPLASTTRSARTAR